MKRKLLPVLLLALACLAGKEALAQEDLPTTAGHCAALKQAAWQMLARTAAAHPAEDGYDVKYVKLDLNIREYTTAIAGVATTAAVVTASSLPEYVFELAPTMVVDSVLINGQPVPVTAAGMLRSARPNAPLPQGSTFTARVVYHGQAHSNPQLGIPGLRSQTAPGSSTSVTFTMSEPYDSRDWWPCKQSLRDKIDSADIWLTVPPGNKGGSNGRLVAVTPLPDGRQRYEWCTRYPIDYYLLSFAVSPYNEYTYYTHFTATDSMPVQNYYYAHWPLTPALKADLDSTGLMIQHFSKLFGRYPFWQEKYGHSLAPLGGGMEHQTMTTLGYVEGYLVAHELAHQWWGDAVTCGTWQDLWLNEGFATYSEYLYASHFRSPQEADARMELLHSDIMQAPGGSVYIPDTTDEERMFSGRLTYNKGGAVLHTLRFEAPTDSHFFALLRQHHERFRFGNATTQDFKQLAEEVYGRHLDAFFRQWVYGEGFPTIGADWNQDGEAVYLRLSQQTSAPFSIASFTTPLDIRLTGIGADTVVRVQLQSAVQEFRVSWSRQVTDLAIDPSNYIINGTGTIRRDPNLTVPAKGLDRVVIFPNPSRQGWSVAGVPENTGMRLTDATGRLVRHSVSAAAGGTNFIEGADLSSGLYLLQLASPDQQRRSLKLLKP